MGVNYLQLMSDDMPAYIVHDHIWNANAQAAHAPRDKAVATQDLIAKEQRENQGIGMVPGVPVKD